MIPCNVAGWDPHGEYRIDGAGRTALRAKLDVLLGAGNVLGAEFSEASAFSEEGRKVTIRTKSPADGAAVREIRGSDCHILSDKAPGTANTDAAGETGGGSEITFMLGPSWFPRLEEAVRREISVLDDAVAARWMVPHCNERRDELMEVLAGIHGAYAQADEPCSTCGIGHLVSTSAHRCMDCEAVAGALAGSRAGVASAISGLRSVRDVADVGGIIALLEEAGSRIDGVPPRRGRASEPGEDA